MNHPLDRPELAAKLSLFRAVCLAVPLILASATAGFGMVVYFALEGDALMGQRHQLFGVSALALAALVLTPVAVLFAELYSRSRGREAARKLLTEPPPADPDTGSPDSHPERLADAVGARLFARYAVLAAAGFALAVLFHLISSALVLGCVAAVALAMAAGHPTHARLRRYYDEAAVWAAKQA